MSAKQNAVTEKLSFDELKELDAHFEEQLNTGLAAPQKKKSFSLKKVVLCLIGMVVSALLPFIVLIRSSLYAYTNYSLNGWLALFTGVLATTVLLMGYAIVVNYAFTKSYRVHKYIRRIIIAVVVAYCGYGLLYLSSINAKTPQVQSYYSSLHPILRVTLATTILADDELIITDLKRSPEDYEAMGLSAKNKSMHYPQSNGYVHAADIRTLGRPKWKNWLLQKTFTLLGLQTLRHIGNADHLHVSLPPKN